MNGTVVVVGDFSRSSLVKDLAELPAIPHISRSGNGAAVSSWYWIPMIQAHGEKPMPHLAVGPPNLRIPLTKRSSLLAEVVGKSHQEVIVLPVPYFLI